MSRVIGPGLHASQHIFTPIMGCDQHDVRVGISLSCPDGPAQRKPVHTGHGQVRYNHIGPVLLVNHRGTRTLTSNPGKGTTAALTLPAADINTESLTTA